MSQDNFTPKIGEVVVYEMEEGKIGRQISVPLESAEDANSFIETMKDGMYYKSMRPEIKLVALQIINIV